jgi:hypothetical protein
MRTKLRRAVAEQLRTHVSRRCLRFRGGQRRNQRKQQSDRNFQFHRQPLLRFIHRTRETLNRIQISLTATPEQVLQNIQLSRDEKSIGEPGLVVTLIPGPRYPDSYHFGTSLDRGYPTCNSLAMKANWSTVASMRLLSGIPAPCPARVSTRIRIGFTPPWASCRAAVYLKLCAG